jgi:hypothetical protein
MKAIKGTFLCFGTNAEPGVILMGEYVLELMNDAMKIAETRCRNVPEARARVYAEYFYPGVEYAIPAWSPDAMLTIVEHYKGPNALRIRTLAAMIYEGKNYGVDPDGRGGGDIKGGQPALVDPVKPKPKRPGGARAKVPAHVPF